jgi:small GTP-binding protein domain
MYANSITGDKISRSSNVKPNMMAKILLLGDPGVGKTSLLNRFNGKKIEDGSPTIGRLKYFPHNYLGVDLFSLDFVHNGTQLKVKFWDTAGDQKYQILNKNFYKGAHGAIIVWDLTREFSLHKIEKWIEETKDEAGDKINIIIVGNKMDLPTNEQTVQMLQDYTSYKDYKYFEASAKTGENVNNLFQEILIQVKETHFNEKADIRESIILRPQGTQSVLNTNPNKCQC